MRLLICKLCEDGEPFACPFKFRRTYMFLHLEKSHGLNPAELAFTKSEPAVPGGPTLWMAERENESRPVLDEMMVKTPSLPFVGGGREPIPGAKAKFAAKASAREVNTPQGKAAGKAARAGFPDWTGASTAYSSMH